MSLDFGFDPPSMPCDDCGEELTAKARQHSLEGFGHYHRCCECYERRQQNKTPIKQLSSEEREMLYAARLLRKSRL